MKQRHAGIELLRIVSMIMVLGLHANFMAFGGPSSDAVLTADGITRTVMQSFCIMAVNVFVMISGWFGIHASVKGFCNFMWQVVFFVGGSYAIEALFFGQNVGFKDMLRVFGLFDGGGWFVASYIGLYILSPILNSYIESTPAKRIALTLTAFFTFEILWGDTLSAAFIACGYSTFSFIGLYVLAGLLHKLKLSISSRKLIAIIIGTTLINAILYITASSLNVVVFRDIILNYINPLVIVSASATLLLFDKATPPHHYSPVLQWITGTIASSCFAAYLLHTGTACTRSLYLECASEIYGMFSGIITLFAMIGYIIVVFMMAVIIDQPRKLIWRKVMLPLFSKMNV